MKKAGVLILTLILGLGAVGLAFAHMSPKAIEGQCGSMMGSGMMGTMGGQMGQMMPMMQIMQACAQMMKRMSPMLGQPGASQQH